MRWTKLRALPRRTRLLVRRTLRSEQLVSLLAAAVIGVGGAIGAIGFRYLIKLFQWLFYNTWEFSVAEAASMPWYALLLLPVAGGLVIGPLVMRWVPEIRGSGIPEVIEAVALRGGRVRKRVAPLKALAAAICIGSGGSAGREGPIVHIGAALGSAIGRLLRAPVGNTRTLVGCGAAAGIAATFNTPFAGVLFAAEVILRDFHLARFSPIVVASVVATLVSHRFVGNFPAIQVPAFSMVSLWELVPYALIGVLSAIVGTLFIRSLERGWSLFGRLPLPPELHPAIGGLVVGLMAVGVPHVLGVGYETINLSLEGQVTLGFALLLLVAKLVATVATLSSGGSGGVFAPSLVMGALLGNSVGIAAGRLLPDLSAPPQAYALVAMGAMVAATTRAPISAVLMIFEMSNLFEVILPLMVACVPATLLSAALHPKSVYTAKLAARGVDLRRARDVNVLRGIRVGDVVNTTVPTLQPDAALHDVVDFFLHTTHEHVVVLDADHRPLGFMEDRDLRQVITDQEALEGVVVARDLANPFPAILALEDELTVATRILGQTGVEMLPVVNAEGEFVGGVAHCDVLETYLHELTHRDAPGTAVDAISLTERVGAADLGGGTALIQVEVPMHMCDRPLRELDLRSSAGVQIVLIIRGEGRAVGGEEPVRIVPTAETVLHAGDRCLLLGTEAQIARAIHPHR